MYLKRKEIKALGKPAIVVKGCDERALVVLEKESQFERKDLHVIGMACDGHGPAAQAAVQLRRAHAALRRHDHRRRPLTTTPQRPSGASRAGRLLAMSRRRAHGLLGGGIRPLRQVLCLPAGLSDVLLRALHRGQEPAHGIDTSATLKGNFAWHIARAFHLAGRCVGCGAVHPGLSGGHRPAAAEPAVGQSRRRALRLSGRG